MSTAALMMLKAPRPGLVKTRLAKEVGDVAAREAYRWMVERQMAELPAGWATVVHFAPADVGDEMRSWLGSAPFYAPQVEGHLGQRMHAAVAAAWEAGYARAVLLGGDCPWVTRELLLRAERELATSDLVIGPAADGGYYLLGLNACANGPFDGVEWSTSRVLAQTLERVRAIGARVTLLPELEDVDDAAAWGRARAVFSDAPGDLPQAGG